MIGQPPSTLKVLQVLSLSALRRLLRATQIARAVRAKQRPSSKGKRTATDRKGGHGLTLLMALMLPVMLLNSLQITARGVSSLADSVATYGPSQAPLRVDRFTLRTLSQLDVKRQAHEIDEQDLLAELRTQLAAHEHFLTLPIERVVDHYMAHGLSGFVKSDITITLLAEPGSADAATHATLAAAGSLLLLTLTVLLLALSLGGANLDLGRAQWTFPWLLTFPVPTRAIVLAKVFEYTLVSLFPWFTVFPIVWQLLRVGDFAGPAWLLAIVATLSVTLIVATLRFGIETWLRLRLSLQGVRSVQGFCTLLALGGWAVVFLIVMRAQPPTWFLDLARHTSPLVSWLPSAWPMALLTDRSAGLVFGLLGTAAIAAMGTAATVGLLANGAERSGGVDPGQRAVGNRPGAKPMRRLTVIGKDLLLLARDRNFAVQTLVVPLFVVAMQLMLQRGTPASFSPRTGALIAYGIGTFALMNGCFSVLSSEGRSLWMLYALPIELHATLRRKVVLWASLGLVFAAAAFVMLVDWQKASATPWTALVDGVAVLGGVWAAAWLAAGIGVLGIDPAADYVPRQPKARHVYLYFYLAGSYCVGLATADFSIRIAALIVFGTLAWSLWQRVTDRLPWLLDPVARGPQEISAYDAGAAVATFFLLQNLIALLYGVASGQLDMLALLVAYAVAGFVTLTIFCIAFAARGLPILERLGFTPGPGRRPWAAVLLGIVVGAALACLALGWQHLGRTHGWFEVPAMPRSGLNYVSVLLLAVIAAPLAEETLFRGLLFAGLRRSVPTWLAVTWSALVFAAVHPVAGWPPVFGLGLATAVLFARSCFLPACMALHGVYNLIIVLAA